MVASPTSTLREIAPRLPRRDDCLFYHSFTLPEGDIAGMWDLRAQPRRYLGEVDFSGRSVLEVGPASGFLSFHMEAAGAQVTCLEPPMSYLWDVVPLVGSTRRAGARHFPSRSGACATRSGTCTAPWIRGCV
jgi:hypothetical protein